MAYEAPVYIGGPPPPAQPLLTYQIRNRPGFADVEVELKQGEQVLADGEAMIFMNRSPGGGEYIQTNANGCGRACKRGCCAGESFCQNTFTGPMTISFGQKLPGDIMPFLVSPDEGWKINAGAFICGTTNIQVDIIFSGCGACICGGEAPFSTQILCPEGQGIFFAGGYGAITRHEVQPGKTFLIDGGLFFACSDKTKIETQLAGGCITCLYGGEGFFMKFTGPCVVFTQNRNPKIWAKVLAPPAKNNKKKQGGAAGGM